MASTTTIAKLLIKIGIQTKEMTKRFKEVEENLRDTKKGFSGLGKIAARTGIAVAAGLFAKKVLTATKEF